MFQGLFCLVYTYPAAPVTMQFLPVSLPTILDVLEMLSWQLIMEIVLWLVADN